MPYALAETVVLTWLKTRLSALIPAVQFRDELPYNLTFVTPLIVVERFGGADTVLGLDGAHIDVDVFHLTKDAAMLLAEVVRQSLRRDLPQKTIAGAVVSRVETISGPSRTPWDDAEARRVSASYRITLHHPLT